MRRHFPGWLVLLGALTALGPLSIDMYLPAFPAIAEALGSDRGSVERSLPIFLAGLVLAQLTYGPISDRFGRRPPILMGLTIYFVGSLGCAWSTQIGELSVWRLIQALGAGSGVVITRAVIRDRLGPRDSARAVSTLMLVMGVAPILAPFAGGLLLNLADWRFLFWVQAAFALICLIWAWFGMDETRPAGAGASLHPMAVIRVYLGLARDPRLMWPALSGGFAMSGMFAYISGSPFVLMTLYGVDEQHYGLYFGFNALGLIAASQLNGWWLLRSEPRRLLARVIWLPALAGVWLVLTNLTGPSPLPLLTAGLFLYVASLGLITPNTGALAMAQQGGRAGAASAVLGTVIYAGGMAAGLAVSLIEARGALPLAAIMAGCGLCAAACGWMTLRDIRLRDPEEPVVTEPLS